MVELLDLAAPVREGVRKASRALGPTAYAQQMNLALSLEKHRAQLPALREIIGGSSVDVFGNYQSYALFNELNYHPRPVFQSYAAYTPGLMKLNEKFCSSSSKPQFVLVRIGPIDDRFAPLEDALVFKDLLFNYTLVGKETSFLLLESTSTSSPEPALLQKGTVRPGEPISLERFGETNLWLELSVQPNFLGRLRAFLYQPPEMQLVVWKSFTSLEQLKFRAPALMMQAGFLASPVIINNEDFEKFFTEKQLSRPTAYSLEIRKTDSSLWCERIHFRIYSIPNASRITLHSTLRESRR